MIAKVLNQPFLTYLIVNTVILIIVSPLSGQQTQLKKNPPMELTEGWLYRLGDSSVSKDGTPRWIGEDSNDLWKQLDGDEFLKNNQGSDFVWYKKKLPDIEWTDPAIFIPPAIPSIPDLQQEAGGSERVWVYLLVTI